MNARASEIREELKKLYAELDKFDEPTPADDPHAYEPEELEAFAKINDQIRVLEIELEKITGVE